MMNMKTEIACQQDWSQGGLNLYVIARGIDGVTHLAQPLVMEPRGEAPAIPAGPTVYLEWKAAQALMDAMYAAGIRPTDAKHANEAMAASKEHIADLRKVAFGLMDRLPAKV